MTGATREVAVIGAGPAGLMAAEMAAAGGVQVTVYDAMPSAGRKLLMAIEGDFFSSIARSVAAVRRALRRGGCASAERRRGFST